MKNKLSKLLLGAALLCWGNAANAQGLEGVIVEDYHTATQADVDFYNALASPGSYPLTVGMKTYRIYIDMAPNYKLNSVFGSAGNTLKINSTQPFWNNDAFGDHLTPQTSRLDDGAAFDSWLTVGRSSRSGGAAGCTTNAEQLGVLRTADTNGNLTMCNIWSGFGPTDNDGNVPGASVDPTLVGIAAPSLLAFTANASSFSTTGSYALLPAQNGPELGGANRVLIAQVTTSGTLSFKINVALTSPSATVEFYTHTITESGSTVSPKLIYPQTTFVGPSTLNTPYLKPMGAGNATTSILTANDVVGGYRMVGIPDGLGAFDNGDGTFTLLMNHEIATPGGIVRAHGSNGSFVSKWVINKSTLQVLSGSDLMQTVQLWNGSGFTAGTTAFSRFCSGDLPPVSAFYNAGTGKGTQNRIYMNGEESGDEGRAVGHIVTGPSAGTSYQLPYLGRFSWENSVACGASGDKTVVAGMDDTSPLGQVYFYIGTKTNTGSDIQKAGLLNGKLYGVKVTGLANEVTGSFPAPNTAFTLFDLGNVSNLTGAQLQTNSVAGGVTGFLRPEDGSWDPSHPEDFYFVTTDAITSPSRMWKLHFTDILQPELGGTITAVLAGTEGQVMMDNITVDQMGHAYIVEDVGNNVRIGQMFQYDITTDNLVQVAYHDSTRFLTGGSQFLTQDEESSGVIDMKDILGKGKYLVDVQAHYSIPGEVYEGGQLLQFATGDTVETCVPASITSITPASAICSIDTLKLNVAASGTLPLTYSWSGTGTFLFGTSSPSALVTGAANGSYAVTVTNACGSANGSVNVTVTPATIYYADVDGDSFGDPNSTQSTCGMQPVGYVADNTDDCPTVFGRNGDICDANPGPAYTLGQLTACVCTAVPCTQNLTIEFQTDANPGQITWEIRQQGSNALVQSGGPLVAPNGIQTENTCVPDGCYYLKVLDSAGDGMVNGGYILRTAGSPGTRLIDNRRNFNAGSVSAIAANEGFCFPLGVTTKGIFTACDKLDWATGEYFVCDPVASVSTQYGGANAATSGYEFWFFNPNGGYSFRKFRSHTVSDGFAPADANRACHIKLNNWAVASQIPNNVLMNVRVRTRIAGVNGQWGAACRLVIDPVRAACPLTKLIDVPGSSQFSCNVTRTFATNSYIYARPVTGANKYQFRFRIDAENFVTVRNSNNYICQLNWNILPLQDGKTYQVEVRASKDNGVTWCIDVPSPVLGAPFTQWGDYCDVTIDNTPANGGNQNMVMENGSLHMYPNPNRGDQLYLSLEAIEEGVNTVSVDIYDTFGKRVSARTIAVQDGFINTVIELNGELASGMYMVNITAGKQQFTERLMIQK